MGKNFRHHGSCVSMGNGHAGCLWGIFHALHRSRWHHVKKILPHRHHNGRRQSTGSNLTPNKPGDTQQYLIEAKNNDPGPVSKISMKSRIKALISEEISKRRVWHRRSSYYPKRTRLDKFNSVHHLQPSDKEDNAEVVENEKTLEKPLSESTICQLCATMLTMNYLRQNGSEELEIEPVKDHTLLQNKFIYAVEPSRSALLQESRLFLDALDLLDIRKEVFTGIIQDPCSSLANHLHGHGQRAFTSRAGLTKSVTFPVAGVSGKRVFRPSDVGNKSENGHTSETPVYRSRHKSLDNSYRRSPLLMKRKHESKVVGKRHFKSIKQTIKHAMKESRKERNRIIMDAVLHKIPNGRRFSKEPLMETFGHKTSYQKKHRFIRRSSSFQESLDQYCHLYDSNFGREAKNHIPRRLNSCTRDLNTGSGNMGRIISLPDLRSYYSNFQCDDSPNETAIRKGNIMNNGQNLVDTTAKNHGGDKSIEELGNLEEGESTSDDPILSFVIDSDFDIDETGPEICKDSKSTPECLYCCNQNQEFDIDAPIDSLHIQVDSKDKPEFDYVKNVLELSGFSLNQSIGTWHSDDQPLDPSLLEKLNEGENCNNLLLFDLINEILFEIYEGSFSYWPKPLTCHSQVRPLPVGSHVLEDVWTNINWYLSLKPHNNQSLDEEVTRDLAKGSRWMGLQFEGECVGLELEAIIFDDLIEELVKI